MPRKNNVTQLVTIRVPRSIIKTIRDDEAKGAGRPTATVLRRVVEEAFGHIPLSKEAEHKRRYRK